MGKAKAKYTESQIAMAEQYGISVEEMDALLTGKPAVEKAVEKTERREKPNPSKGKGKRKMANPKGVYVSQLSEKQASQRKENFALTADMLDTAIFHMSRRDNAVGKWLKANMIEGGQEEGGSGAWGKWYWLVTKKPVTKAVGMYLAALGFSAHKTKKNHYFHRGGMKPSRGHGDYRKHSHAAVGALASDDS